jgi:hypothetical protein
MKKIGVGVTTFNRPDELQNFEEKFAEAWEHNSEYTYPLIHIAEDTLENRRGVAKVKNECLFHLKECDYIFLFDDDCFPIKKGWHEVVINAHLETGNHHFAYTKEPFCKKSGTYFHKNVTLESFNGSGGVFLFYTKECIEKVGGFYTGYGLYGYEHMGHSIRIKKAQLTFDWFLSIKELDNYIFAKDYEIEGFFANQSSISLSEKIYFTDKAKIAWIHEDNEIKRPIIYR